MNGKVIGGTLLIIGTSIGGGMLALPVTTAPAGFWHSSLLLFISWALMTFAAFLILEVNLWLPRDSNIISMAKLTLGKPGEFIAWISYMVLLYSLISAYISGGADISHELLGLIKINIPSWVDACLFTGILGYVVFNGIQIVDYCNRGLMLTKIALYFLLVIFIAPHVDATQLRGGNIRYLVSAVTIMITSYGFATIVPSLRSYYDDDLKKLRLTLFIGSFIPLVFYILWDLVILGSLPMQGKDGLTEMLHSGHSNSEFVQAVSLYLHNRWVSSLAHFFTSICVATSFLGVSLGLTDFLADGLKIKKVGAGKLFIIALTFLPPLVMVLFYPSAFLMGLSYAGICCMVLLLLLPALMAWSGRYVKHIATGYQVMGGKGMLGFITLVAIGTITVCVLQDFLHLFSK